MLRFLLAFILCSACACGSSSDSAVVGAIQGGSGNQADGGNSDGGNSGDQGCPDVSGTWKITKHCDPSLVGMTLDVTQKDCALSFVAPFDQFTGSVTTDDKITLSGPQSCTGSVTAGAISMDCTPAPCNVTLAR